MKWKGGKLSILIGRRNEVLSKWKSETYRYLETVIRDERRLIKVPRSKKMVHVNKLLILYQTKILNRTFQEVWQCRIAWRAIEGRKAGLEWSPVELLRAVCKHTFNSAFHILLLLILNAERNKTVWMDGTVWTQKKKQEIMCQLLWNKSS